MVAQGVSNLPEYVVRDWAFVPGQPSEYLFQIGINPAGATYLMRFTTTTALWETIGSYGTTVTGQADPGYSALFASNDTFLYASEGKSGQIWKFSLEAPFTAVLLSNGPASVQSDGARCVANTLPIEMPAPEIACSVYGYLVQFNTLYQVDLATGDVSPFLTLGNGTRNVNGIGYNSLDNFLYGFTTVDRKLNRIGGDGSLEDIGSNSDFYFLIGDIDQNGQMYSMDTPVVATGAMRWQQVNLNPNQPTSYGQVVANGTGIGCNYFFADMAYVPSGGDFLYAVGMDAAGTTPYLIRWGRTTHNCETLSVLSIRFSARAVFGAFYASSDGFLYGSENNSGGIYRIRIQEPYEMVLSSTGPVSSSNDGARCITNTESVGN